MNLRSRIINMLTRIDEQTAKLADKLAIPITHYRGAMFVATKDFVYLQQCVMSADWYYDDFYGDWRVQD